MNRRDILKFTLGLGALSLMTSIFRKFESNVNRIDVIFTLPKCMSFDEFDQSVNSWVDVATFESIQENYQKQGLMTSFERCKIGSNTLRSTFHFSDNQSLENFIKDIASQCNYNFEARAKLGTTTTSFINGRIRNFYQLEAFTG